MQRESFAQPTAFALVLLALPLPWSLFFGTLGSSDWKTLYAAVAFGVGCILFALVPLVLKRAVVIPRTALLFLGIPLIAAGYLSLYTSGVGSGFWWERSFSTGEIGALVLYAAAVISGSLVSARTAVRLFAFSAVSILVAAIAYVLFALMSPSLVEKAAGDWPNLAFLLAGVLAACTALYDVASNASQRRWYILGTGLSLALFIALMHRPAIFALLALLGLIASTMFVRSGWRRTPPLSAFLGILILLALIIGPKAPLVAHVSEAKPSFFATMSVIVPVYADGTSPLLFGTGPGSFAEVWEKHRPLGYNQTPLWNTSLERGYSAATDIALSFGALGLASLLLCPFALLFLWVRRNNDEGEGYAAPFEAFALLSLAACASLLAEPANTPMLLFAALSAGVSIRLAFEDRTIALPTNLVVIVPATLALAVFGGTFAWSGVRQIIATTLHERGAAAIKDDGFTAEGVEFLTRAAGAFPSAAYQRDAAQALFRRALSQYASEPFHTEESTAALARAVGGASTLLNFATLESARDYRTWLVRASIDYQLVGLDAEAPARAVQALEQAAVFAPTRPDVPYLQALLFERMGDKAAALDFAQRAADLKPDYTDALALRDTLRRVLSVSVPESRSEGGEAPEAVSMPVATSSAPQLSR